MYSSGKLSLLLFLSVLLNPLVGLPDELPDFTGAWAFDSRKSDDLRKLLSRSLEQFNPAGLRLVQTPRGVVAMGNYIEKPTDEKIEAVYGYLNSIAPFDQFIRIQHTDPLLRLIYADGRQRDVYTDERDSSTAVQSTSMQRDQKLVLASWDGSKKRVVIETNSNSGTTIIETITLQNAHKPEKMRIKHELKIESVRLPKVHKITYYYQFVLAQEAP